MAKTEMIHTHTELELKHQEDLDIPNAETAEALRQAEPGSALIGYTTFAELRSNA